MWLIMVNDENLTKYSFSVEQLIQLKEKRQKQLRSKHFDLLSCERALKNAENKLYLKTDFQKLGLTNDKKRNSYVSDNTYKLRFRLDMAKYELKQEEDELNIINDLINYRLKGE